MKLTEAKLKRMIREAMTDDPAALARTRELYDMINQLRSEEEDLKMHMEQYVEQEIVYGGDASTARFDYEDDYPEKASRIRAIEMEIEDAFTEIENLGDLPYD